MICFKKSRARVFFAVSLIVGGFTAANDGVEVRQVQNGDKSYVEITRTPTLDGERRYGPIIVSDEFQGSTGYADIAEHFAKEFRSA